MSALLSPDDFAISQPCVMCGVAAGQPCLNGQWDGQSGNMITMKRLVPHFGRAGMPRARGYGLYVAQGKVHTYRIPGPGKAVDG